MEERIPNIIKPLLYQYEKALRERFKNKIYGVYIYNSVALGAFDENKSDIDFITIINEGFTKDEIEDLRKIHHNLKENFHYGKIMEGMYIDILNLGKTNSDMKPYMFFADEVFNDCGYYDINYVTWWTLKNKGIAINSPEISTLGIEVSWDNVIKNMGYNLNGYWGKKVSEKATFFTDYWIEFSVLTLCRILYTLEYKDITSKANATKKAMDILPNQFQNIINEALRIRKNFSVKSIYESTEKRAHEVKTFISYVINYCNKKYSLVE